MHSIAFHLGSLTVHWYGIMIALGYLAGITLMLRRRGMAQLEQEQVFDLSLATIIAGILGARIFYVAQFWSRDGFDQNLLSIFRIDNGGLVFYGGFLCSMLAIWIYCRVKRRSALSVMDMMAPALALGHAFGRVGCFLEGCCYGKPSNLPWAVSFPAGSRPAAHFPSLEGAGKCPSQGVHPVQLYEVIANLAICGLLLALGRNLKPGQVAAAYLGAYGAMRFTLEFFRGDHSDHLFGVLTPSQAISVFLLIPAAAALFIYLGRRKSDAAA